MSSVTLLAVLFSPAAALLVQPPGPSQRQRTNGAVQRISNAAAAAAAAFGTCEVARADFMDDVMTELNKPPITLNPFTMSPSGQAFFVGYAAYLAWQIFRPPSEAEQEIERKRETMGAAAAAAAPAFLSAAAEAPGATTTDSGLVYEKIEAGEGASPTLEQTVRVHYTGTLADGTVFDSSRDRGEPTEFKLGQVIKGWQEGLSLMKPGGRAKITMPAQLAYGEAAIGSIPPNSALCFDVELLEVKEETGFKLPFM